MWRASLDLPPERVWTLFHTLAPDEQEQARRFRFRRDRDRFVVARATLRAILGRYLRVGPGRVRFRYGAFGKPALADPFEEERLRFNMAHSHRLALYAVARGREVGIDLEYMRDELADERVAEHFFAPREVAALRAVPGHRRKEAFFNCWTRKEAYVKARGEGLLVPLDRFEVSLAPGEPATLRTPGDPSEAARWSLLSLSPHPDYAAALVVEGHTWRLRCWQWCDV